MIEIWRRAAKSVRLWVLFFLVLQVICGMKGGTNADSRLALFSALVEDHQFQIDPYQNWTVDWAQTPDGHYYSNKAPGPVLVALPAFWLLDKLVTFSAGDRRHRDERRRRFSTLTLPILSLLFQALPWALLTLLFSGKLRDEGASPLAQMIFALAFLFGNTASLFMNSFFGHGFSAVAAGFALWFLFRRRFFEFGLAWGIACLSDYGMALSFPFALSAVLFAGEISQMQRRVIAALFGLMVPAFLWGFYHLTCFGGVLTLPQAFQNPIFVDLKSESQALWGVISLIPKSEILGELLFGKTRGVLWTQPWVFWVVGAWLWRRRERRDRWEILFVAGSFLGLLGMNAAFGAWHGGGTPGPRYLASVLPLFAFWTGRYWDTASHWARQILGFMVTVSVLWCFIIYSSLRVADSSIESLWPYYVARLRDRVTNVIRVFGILLAAAWTWRRTKAECA